MEDATRIHSASLTKGSHTTMLLSKEAALKNSRDTYRHIVIHRKELDKLPVLPGPFRTGRAVYYRYPHTFQLSAAGGAQSLLKSRVGLQSQLLLLCGAPASLSCSAVMLVSDVTAPRGSSLILRPEP